KFSNGPDSARPLPVPVSKIDIIKTSPFSLIRFMIFISNSYGEAFRQCCRAISPSRYSTTLLFLGRPHARFSSSLRRVFGGRRPSFHLSNTCAVLSDRADADDSYRPLVFAPMAFWLLPDGSTENSPSRTRAMPPDRSPAPAPTFSARSTSCEILL